MPDNQIVQNPIESVRDYELSLLSWIVVLPINGGTDWHVVAAFASNWDASQYCRWLNAADPGMEYPYELRPIGTRHHEVTE